MTPEVYRDDSAFVEVLDPFYAGATFGPSIACKLVVDFDTWQERASKMMGDVSTARAPTEAFAEPASPEFVYDDAFYLAFW